MEAALLLLVLVFVDTIATVWIIARHREYLRRVTRLETRMDRVNDEDRKEKKVEYDLMPVDGASEQDYQQARAILDALMNGKNDA